MADRWHYTIGGQCEAATSGQYVSSFDPGVSQTAAQVAAGDAIDVAPAVAAAGKAAEAWHIEALHHHTQLKCITPKL